jgi:hypothetical protein
MKNSPYSVIILVACCIACVSMSVLIPQICYGPTQFSYHPAASSVLPGLLTFLLSFCAACLPYIMLSAVAVLIRRLSAFGNVVFCSASVLLAGAGLIMLTSLAFPGGGDLAALGVVAVLIMQVVGTFGVFLLTLIAELSSLAYNKLRGHS